MKKLFFTCFLLNAAIAINAQQNDFTILANTFLSQNKSGLSSKVVASKTLSTVTAEFSWLQYSDPEMAGFSDKKLQKALEYAEELNSAAVMLVYKGKVVIAWGNVNYPDNCHSMRKAFLSALYGIYSDNGVIDLQKTLADLNIDDITPLTRIEKQATVEHLLQSRSGIYLRAMGDGSSMIANKPVRGSDAPGEHYHYNNWGFNALGTIFEQETGKGIFSAFKEKIADPIGMEDFTLSLTEMRSVDYTRHRYYSFRMSTLDLARFGLLYQQEGIWKGKRIISESWVERSTQSYSNTGQGGYGYLWKTFPRAESMKYGFKAISNYDLYAISGIGVHMLAVIPELDIVFVHRFDSDNSIPHYESLPVYKLLDLLIAAKEDEIINKPWFVSLKSIPFPQISKTILIPDKIKLADEVLGSYEGNYYLPPVKIKIKKDGDHLQHMEADGSVFDNLYPESENKFFYESWDRKMEFVRDEYGYVTHYYLIVKGVKEKAIKIN